jgi:protein phosphatase 2C
MIQRRKRMVLGNDDWDYQGSTVIASVLHDDCVTTANIGDSRAILCRNKKAIALSDDHKPNRPSEYGKVM